MVVRVAIWFILKERESTSLLNNTNKPERSQKTSRVDDHRVFPLIKRNHISVSSQVKNSPEEADVSLMTSTMNRHLQQ